MFPSLRIASFVFLVSVCCELHSADLDSAVRIADVAVLGMVIKQDVTRFSNGTVETKFDFVVYMSSRGGNSNSKLPELLPGDTLRMLDYKSPSTKDTLYVPTYCVFVLSHASTSSGWQLHLSRIWDKGLWWSHEFFTLDTVWFHNSYDPPGTLNYETHTTSGEWKTKRIYTQSDSLISETKTHRKRRAQIKIGKTYRNGMLVEHTRTKFVYNCAVEKEWKFRQGGRACLHRTKRRLPRGHW